MIIGCRVGFPKPDPRGQKDFAEMAEHRGISLREMLDVGTIGVGKRVKRQALCRALKQRGNARHFACEDFIPPFQELGIGELDAER
jgi:hypothetical protein